MGIIAVRLPHSDSRAIVQPSELIAILPPKRKQKELNLCKRAVFVKSMYPYLMFCYNS